MNTTINPLKWLILKRLIIPSVFKDVEHGENGILTHCRWEYTIVQLLCQNYFLFVFQLDLPYDPAKWVLVIYSGEMKAYVHQRLEYECTLRTLFIIIKT